MKQNVDKQDPDHVLVKKQILPPFLDIRCIVFPKKGPKYKVYCVEQLSCTFFYGLGCIFLAHANSSIFLKQ
jgi:hypothetical protein